MISATQALLARTLLKLSQKEVAAQLGMAHTTLSAIEKGQSDPPASRLTGMQSFYEGEGVEFLNRDGVRRKPMGMMELKGYEGFKEFIYGVYETVKNGGDVCVTNVDERQFERWLSDYRADYMMKMERVKKLDFRVLVQENDDFFLAAGYASYKRLPSKYFTGVPTYVYGSKKAEILFDEDTVTVFVIDNARMANAQRKSFDLAWEQAFEPV